MSASSPVSAAASATFAVSRQQLQAHSFSTDAALPVMQIAGSSEHGSGCSRCMRSSCMWGCIVLATAAAAGLHFSAVPSLPALRTGWLAAWAQQPRWPADQETQGCRVNKVPVALPSCSICGCLFAINTGAALRRCGIASGAAAAAWGAAAAAASEVGAAAWGAATAAAGGAAAAGGGPHAAPPWTAASTGSMRCRA